jgi:hypothetical protein
MQRTTAKTMLKITTATMAPSRRGQRRAARLHLLRAGRPRKASVSMRLRFDRCLSSFNRAIN